MDLPRRPAAPLLLGLAIAAAGPARAGITGNAEVQALTTENSSRTPGGSTQSTSSTLLMESLSLHYAGLPFGPAVAVATAGGAFSNMTGWYGGGLKASGQVLSFDGSLGFLPRRSVPLRLYGGMSLLGGGGGLLATGGGPSLVYGGSLSLEPGAVLPGLRLDASESRSSRPGLERFADAQRRLVASAYQAVAGQSLTLNARIDTDHREGAGDVRSRAATLLWSSSLHQTTLLASDVHRSVPFLNGIAEDRQVGAASEQRWSPSLSTQLAGRLSEARADSALGRLGDARASFTWRPISGARQLALSGGASAGFTRTSSPAEDSSGGSWGASGRASYGQQLGPVAGNLSLGAATTTCACRFGSDGTTTLLDATASLALQPAARGSAQADYTVARAAAPLGRGGDRVENHARALGRLRVGEEAHLDASLAWDDGVREILDITSGRAVSLHERGLSGSLGATTRLGRIAPSAEVRHARNGVVTDGSPFVAGGPRLVHAITSAQVGASWSPREDLGVQGYAVGSWTELRDAPDMTALGAHLSFTWRLGRLVASAQLQTARTRIGDSPAALQHSIRAVLTRPFEF